MKNALTQDEVCKEYNLSYRTIYRLRKLGVLHARKLIPGKKSITFYFRDEIEAAMKVVDVDGEFLDPKS